MGTSRAYTWGASPSRSRCIVPWAWRSARIAAGVTVKHRFALPPRSGVGSENADLR